VLLRRPGAEDIEAWTDLYLDPELCRYTGGTLSRQAAWSKALAVAGSWDLLGLVPFSIVEIATGRWAGCVGPWCPPDWPGNELGWRLARWAQGKGYATEGARWTGHSGLCGGTA
jgi:RimJ/RimL family protein N-acetyltransferase